MTSKPHLESLFAGEDVWKKLFLYKNAKRFSFSRKIYWKTFLSMSEIKPKRNMRKNTALLRFIILMDIITIKNKITYFF